MRGQEMAIDVLEREACAQVRGQPDYRQLLTTSAIGQVLGLTILLETGPMARFAGVGNYPSYSRLVGAERLSNAKRKGRGNTKSGNKYLAWAYLEAVPTSRCATTPRSSVTTNASGPRPMGWSPSRAWRTSWPGPVSGCSAMAPTSMSSVPSPERPRGMRRRARARGWRTALQN